MPPENIRKPVIFWYFQGVQKETSSMKWVKFIGGPQSLELQIFLWTAASTAVIS